MPALRLTYLQYPKRSCRLYWSESAPLPGKAEISAPGNSFSTASLRSWRSLSGLLPGVTMTPWGKAAAALVHLGWRGGHRNPGGLHPRERIGLGENPAFLESARLPTSLD